MEIFNFQGKFFLAFVNNYLHVLFIHSLVFILSMAALCVGHGMMLHKSYNNVMGKKSSADFTG